MLEVRDLSFDYQEKPLLHQLTFTLRAGELLHLRGQNGAGKTTLLKLLSGLLYPQQGEIFFAGQPIAKDLKWYQQNICYVGHRTGINPFLTVRENCYFDMHWGRQDINFPALLARFKLQDLEDELAMHLSAGQKRRVGLLRIAMTDASLWLLDEPLIALDKEAIELFIELLETHLSCAGQVIFTSHQSLPSSQLSCLEYSL